MKIRFTETDKDGVVKSKVVELKSGHLLVDNYSREDMCAFEIFSPNHVYCAVMPFHGKLEVEAV